MRLSNLRLTLAPQQTIRDPIPAPAAAVNGLTLAPLLNKLALDQGALSGGVVFNSLNYSSATSTNWPGFNCCL